MNLTEILRSAQDGQAIPNLARHHGLTPEQAAAAGAMLPVFSLALERLKSRPDALGALVTELAGGGHEASWAATAAGTAAATAAALLFGEPEAVRETVERVSRASGVAPATVAEMLPEVATILLGGLAHAMAKQGSLGDLAAAASSPEGLGGSLGRSGDTGGLARLLVSIFGASREPARPETVALAGGVAALAAMFAVGVQASQAQQAALAAIAQSTVLPPTSI